jgi:hypothetical protein
MQHKFGTRKVHEQHEHDEQMRKINNLQKTTHEHSLNSMNKRIRSPVACSKKIATSRCA